MAKLQDTLDKMFGQLNIAQTQLPEYFETGLNPSKRLRPYQEECMKYFLTYMNPDKNFYGNNGVLICSSIWLQAQERR